MLINEKVRKIIDSFSNISKSMAFSYPLTGFKNKSGDILVFLDMNMLDVSDFEEFGIINFSEYSNIIKILGEDSKITLKDGIITIQGQEKTSVRYLTTDLRVLQDWIIKTKNHADIATALNNFNNYPIVVEFDITDKNMSKLSQISSVLKFTDFIIKADNDVISIQVKNRQKTTNDFSLELTGKTNKSIEMLLNVENFNKIPNNSYKATIFSLPPTEDKFIIRLTSDNLPGVSVFMTPKAEQ